MSTTTNIDEIDLSLFCEQSVNPIIITKGTFDGPNNPEILYVNDALCAMSGYSAHEVIGQTPKIFQGPKSNRTLLDKLKENLTNGESFEGFTINYKKDGTEYFIQWNISPIKDRNGEIKYYIGIQRDMTDSITHIEYLENKIKSMQDEKEFQEQLIKESQKAAALGEMIDAVAHQWSQPISVMRGWSEMVDDENIQTKLMEQLDHLYETLNEFRTFFRPDKEPEKFCINNIINSALFLLKDTTLASGVKVETNFSDDLSLVGFPNEFKHIIINLVKNSIDAFVLNDIQKRQITIETVNDESFSYIVYRDNAGGIPEEVLPKIFDKHFTTKEKSGGTGIGLFFSKQIIEKINGEIIVENVDDGVCFIIKFPG